MRSLGAAGSAFSFGVDVGEAGADHFFDESGGERLVDGELNGSFGKSVRFQVVLELRNHGSGGKEGAMVCERGKPDDDLFVFEGRDAIADDLGSLRGKDSADRSADGFEGGALRFRGGGEILADGGGRLPGSRVGG